MRSHHINVLRECAAPFDSGECTVADAHVRISAEFRRRQKLAAEAISGVIPAGLIATIRSEIAVQLGTGKIQANLSDAALTKLATHWAESLVRTANGMPPFGLDEWWFNYAD